MYIFCVRVGFEIQYASYLSKHASQSLSDRTFYAHSVLRRMTWKLQISREFVAYRATAILSETFFVRFKVALGIRLQGELRPETRIGRFLIPHCLRVDTASPSINRYLVRNDAWKKLTHLMTAYFTHQRTALLQTVSRELYSHWKTRKRSHERKEKEHAVTHEIT